MKKKKSFNNRNFVTYVRISSLKKQLSPLKYADHLPAINYLLKLNIMDTGKIPSIRKVKKQKQVISLQLHPDKAGNVSEEEKLAKEEEMKIFNASNKELMEYLIKHQVFVEDYEEEKGLS